jgi:type IV pilus assembly protein PilF
MKPVSSLARTGALLAVVAMLSACAGGIGDSGSVEPTVDTGTVSGDAGDPRNRSRANTELAALYFERGNLGVALEVLRTAVASDPGYAPAHSMFGLVYMELKENKLAEASFERALRLAPGDADINHNYAWFLCQTGRELESIRYFLQAIRNPLYAQAWKSYSAAGQCSLRRGNTKEATDFFERALRLEPDEPVSMIKLADLRYRAGGLEESRRLVQRFNKLVEPTAESLWLAVRIERKLGEKVAENSFANQLRRRFPASSEFQQMQRGEYD